MNRESRLAAHRRLAAIAQDPSVRPTHASLDALQEAAGSMMHTMSPEDQETARELISMPHDRIAARLRGGGLGKFIWGLTRTTLPLLAGAAGTAVAENPIGGILASQGVNAALGLIQSKIPPRWIA